MEINQDINYQKHTIDLSQTNLPKHFPENNAAVPQGAGSKISTDTASGAATVSLSEEGRAASFKFDFNATTDNLLKMEALGNSNSFGKAHASISYENVKSLLE